MANEESKYANKFENHSMERLTLGLGLMSTVKPLIQVFQTFTRLKVLTINNLTLGKLHFMALDNFILVNGCFQKLALINVGMGSEGLKLIAPSLSKARLRSLDLSQNKIGDQGARELASVLSLPSCQFQKLKLNQCMI